MGDNVPTASLEPVAKLAEDDVFPGSNEVTNYPLEVPREAIVPRFKVGDAAYYMKAANLCREAGVAAWQAQWHEGKVTGYERVLENFLQYTVEPRTWRADSRASSLRII